MGGRTTCTTCGMVWENQLDYMQDVVKCGGDHCPLVSESDRAAAKKMATNTGVLATVASLFKSDADKKTIVDISYGTIPNKNKLPLDRTYEVDVPRVIYMELRRG